MSTTTKIIETKQEIQKCIEYLMNALQDRLNEERTKVFKTGKIKTDYRFPFEVQFDELPYFSLYVNLKKAVYEKLLILCYNEEDLTEQDWKELAGVGVVEQDGEIKLKSLKDFATKPISYMELDLCSLEEYLDTIELCLLHSAHSNPVLAILTELVDCERVVYNRIKADGVLPHNIVDSQGYFEEDYLYELKKEQKGNWFYSRVVNEFDNIIAEKSDKEFTFPCGEHIGWAFMNAKDFIDYNPTSKYADRNYVLDRINDNYFEKFTAVLNTVVDILAIPAYAIPYEVILTILEQTLSGMKRVVFAKKLKVLSDNKELSKGELKEALGYSNDKFSPCVTLYGVETVPEDEIRIALRKLDKPETLFDI